MLNRGGDSDFSAMLCKEHVTLLSKTKSERQLDISIRCPFCDYEIKSKMLRHCHGNDGIFPSIITMCRFSNIDPISPISGVIIYFCLAGLNWFI